MHGFWGIWMVCGLEGFGLPSLVENDDKVIKVNLDKGFPNKHKPNVQIIYFLIARRKSQQ